MKNNAESIPQTGGIIIFFLVSKTIEDFIGQIDWSDFIDQQRFICFKPNDQIHYHRNPETPLA